jgi:hypothetical protein
MAARRHDHKRPLADPHHVGDVFASGFDLQDFEDWVRVVSWVDIVDNAHVTRRKVASIVVPRSALHALMQELRGSIGGYRDVGRH